MPKPQDVIIVIDDKAIRVPRKVWNIYTACADQMIRDSDLRDYYKGIEKKTVLDAVVELHDKVSM